MLAAIPFPEIDPILITLGPIAIRWYGLAYVAGLLFGWWYLIRLARFEPKVMEPEEAGDFLTWAVLGVVLGGRLGYVFFYQPGLFLANPVAILTLWEGGMSFHGGFLGVVVAGILFTRRREIEPLRFADMLSCVAPVGLFLGRIANFVNGELFGRVTDVPWGVVFPRGAVTPDLVPAAYRSLCDVYMLSDGPVLNCPRHASQLYEAALEGLVLLVVVNWLWRRDTIRNRPGVATGVFIAGYAIARSIVEFFRQPDAHIGLLALGSTMGQWLSLPMLAVGIYLIVRSKVKT